MRAGVPVRTTAVWIGLMAATCLTLWLGASHNVVVVVAIPIAFLKVYLIGREFMELHDAPVALRAVFTAWAMGVAATTTALYLL